MSFLQLLIILITVGNGVFVNFILTFKKFNQQANVKLVSKKVKLYLYFIEAYFFLITDYQKLIV